MTEDQVMDQFKKNLNKIVFDAVQQSWQTDQAPALEQSDRRTKMKTYEIKIHTLEEWELPDGNMHNSYVKSERIIDVDFFKDALDYVQKYFVAKGVTITYLKIKEIN